MMDGLLVVVVIFGLIVVLLLLIYLIDRVNTIERETRQMKASASKQAIPSQDPYAGMSGRKLWDAMVAAPPAGVDAAYWASVRNRFALLLQLHIESLFEEGQKDAQRGLSGEPKNPRMISTPDGAIESWLPVAQVKALYQAGLDAHGASEETLMGIRVALNEAGRALYTPVGLLPAPLQSDLLLPGPLPDLAARLGETGLTGGAQAPGS